jgi:hypothetical protein
MKYFLDFLMNVRIGVAEIGATLGLIFLIVYACGSSKRSTNN